MLIILYIGFIRNETIFASGYGGNIFFSKTGALPTSMPRILPFQLFVLLELLGRIFTLNRLLPGIDGLYINDSYSIKNTVNPRAPWAPITSDCSMSAVLEGPATKAPHP